MAFLCVCPQKSLELGDDEKLHRAVKERLIVHLLTSHEFNCKGKVVRCSPGGGIAVEGEGFDAKIAQEGPLIAAITGYLQNYAYLVKKYLQEELGLPCNVTLEAIRERSPISEAALLCKLYERLGTGFLSKIRGHFSFVIYDSTTVRVLAARDPSGTVPLVHGHLSDNTLFVTSGQCQPANTEDLVEIQPGHYKYGWRALPRKYANPESEAKTSADAASKAALAALAGLLPTTSSPVKSPIRRKSFDVDRRPGPRPRGRRSLDIPRTAAGSPQKLDMERDRNGIDKPTGLADQEEWWRTTELEKPAGELEHPQDDDKATPTTGKKKKSRRRKKSRKTKKEDTKGQSAAGDMVECDTSNEQSSDGGVPYPKNAEEFISELPEIFRDNSASARMLRNLLKCSPCSVVVTDARQDDHPIVYVNDNFAMNTGYSAQEVVGKNCRFLQAPPGAYCGPSGRAAAVRKALLRERSVSIKIMNYAKDGSPLWNELSIFPLRDAEGRITHHVGMQNFSPATEEDRDGFKEADIALEPLLRKSPLLRSRSCSDISSAESILTQQLETFAF